ncbi:MAG: DUF6134 family protein [Betaproteobacteria bacterium]|jgi:hypothetical protein
MPAPTARLRRAIYAAATFGLALAGVESSRAATSPEEWNFTVQLDGKPIGAHRFVLASAGDRYMALRSEARFDVTLLGISLYRYRHGASERWADGCLASIDARTDDDGRLTEVRGQVVGARFDLQVQDEGRPATARAVPAGCLMSFAYWNPALARQKYLLDPGSGRIEQVVMASPPDVPADLDAQAQPVRGLRIGGLAQPIDVWYVGDRWVGLDTFVSGGRRLSYRLP